MKTRYTHTKALALFALIGIFVGTVALWNATHVKAFQEVDPRPADFGIINLAPTQTLRLNVANLYPPGPCRPGANKCSHKVALGFNTYARSERSLDSAGAEVPSGPCINTYQFAGTQSCKVTLGPGESASFDYVAPADAGALTQVLPAVQDDGGKQGGLIYTLELRQGGVTTFVMNPGTVRGFNPQPEPPGIPAGR